MDRRIELGSKTLGIPRNWGVKWDKFMVGTKMELRSKMVLRSARAVEYKMGERSGRQIGREIQTHRQTDGERARLRDGWRLLAWYPVLSIQKDRIFDRRANPPRVGSWTSTRKH